MSGLLHFITGFGDRRTLSFAVICIASLSPLLTNSFAATGNPASLHSQQELQPLDPLTPEETELATRIASSDPRVKKALGTGRQQFIQVQFYALKPAEPGKDAERLQIGRHAAVLFYRYDLDRGIHVVVDLEKRSVGEITRIEGKSVPLGNEEVTEAFNLAVRDERVRSLLGPRLNEYRVANLAEGERPESRVEGLRVVATSPRDRCYRHRCIDLLFHDREGYVTGTSVTVDLTAQTVRAERTVR
jgi:hypothetical protein